MKGGKLQHQAVVQFGTLSAPLHSFSSFQTDGCMVVDVRSGLVAIVWIFCGGEQNKISVSYCLSQKIGEETQDEIGNRDYLGNRNYSYFRIKARAHQEPAE